MKNDIQEPTQEEIDRMHARLAKDAKQGGYYLNPDIDFVKGLINGLIVNERRYGYQDACARGPLASCADQRRAHGQDGAASGLPFHGASRSP